MWYSRSTLGVVVFVQGEKERRGGADADADAVGDRALRVAEREGHTASLAFVSSGIFIFSSCQSFPRSSCANKAAVEENPVLANCTRGRWLSDRVPPGRLKERTPSRVLAILC